MSDFKPPKPNKVIIALSEILLPFYLNSVERLAFGFSQSPGLPVEFLKGKRAAIVINHSDRQDPLLVVALAKYMKEEFYCIAAREVFDWSYGVLGWLFQRFGCFSVDRGTTDFRSIHTIQKILTDTQNKFIVFPEGEVTGDDHHIHEIPVSLMHIFLKVQAEIESQQSSESLWILPVGVCYSLKTKLKDSVAKPLTKVERHLGIKWDRMVDTETRTQNALIRLITKLGERYQFFMTETQPLHEQIRKLAEHICKRTCIYQENEHIHGKSAEHLLHSLRSEFSKSPSLKGKDSSTKRIASEILNDLDRAERLMIVQRVVNQSSTPIQVCRTVDFLESELFGRMTAKGKQKASVFFGLPIEVLPYMKIYHSDKNAAADSLKAAVHDRLQAALDQSRYGQGVTHAKTQDTTKELEVAK